MRRAANRTTAAIRKIVEKRVDISRSQSCAEDRSGWHSSRARLRTAKVHRVAGAITVKIAISIIDIATGDERRTLVITPVIRN